MATIAIGSCDRASLSARSVLLRSSSIVSCYTRSRSFVSVVDVICCSSLDAPFADDPLDQQRQLVVGRALEPFCEIGLVSPIGGGLKGASLGKLEQRIEQPGLLQVTERNGTQ